MTDVAAQARMLANRVKKNFRRLHRPFERQEVGAFRVYDWDIPELRLVVDWYEGHLVAAEYARAQTDAIPGWLEAMAAACAEALVVAPEQVHVRRRRTRPAEGERYPRLGETGARFPVRERGLRFLVNLDDYLDTGLFNDHRETRALVRAAAAGKSLLNLFCYTGSFTCAAAAGGARESASVDASSAYLDWARANLELNGLAGPQHALVRRDARAFLAGAARERRAYDLIVLDPPSFSTPRPGAAGDEAVDLDVLRDHRALVEQCLALLAPGGTLWFSTNHQRFEPRLDGLGAAVEEITDRTLPPDYRRKAHRCFRVTR